MRIFRGPQNQVLTFKNVNETGIALNDLDCKIQNPVESLMKSIGAGNAADALVQNIYMRIINRNRRGHSLNPSAGETACPIAISDRDNKAKLRVHLPWIQPTATYPRNAPCYHQYASGCNVTTLTALGIGGKPYGFSDLRIRWVRLGTCFSKYAWFRGIGSKDEYCSEDGRNEPTQTQSAPPAHHSVFHFLRHSDEVGD